MTVVHEVCSQCVRSVFVAKHMSGGLKKGSTRYMEKKHMSVLGVIREFEFWIYLSCFSNC